MEHPAPQKGHPPHPESGGTGTTRNGNAADADGHGTALYAKDDTEPGAAAAKRSTEEGTNAEAARDRKGTAEIAETLTRTAGGTRESGSAMYHPPHPDQTRNRGTRITPGAAGNGNAVVTEGAGTAASE